MAPRSRGPDGVLPGGASLAGESESAQPCVTSLSTYQKAPEFSFGGRSKVLSQLEVPGAGSYECSIEALARHARPPKFSFGGATRKEPRRMRAPGPGAYVAGSLFGRTGPSFSLTPRREERPARAREKMPGPGSHQVTGSVRSVSPPKYTMSPRRPTEVRPHPGPGDYNGHEDAALRRAIVPSWGFGSSRQRPRGITDLGDTTPGPGAYRHDSQLTGPQFSMRARTSGAKERLAKF